MKKLKRTSGIILSLIMMLQLIIPCAYAAGNSVKIKTEVITSADTSISVEVQSAITGGFMKIIELPSGEEYNPSNFFNYTSYKWDLQEKNIIWGVSASRSFFVLPRAWGGAIQMIISVVWTIPHDLGSIHWFWIISFFKVP